MDYMAGSVSEIRQYYFADDSTAADWSDPTTEEGQMRRVRAKQREFSYFLQGRLEGE